MRVKAVVGLTYDETIDIEKETNISIETDMGVVGLYAKYKTWKECCTELIKAVNKKYNTNIPHNAKLFSADGDQNFDFYIGFMF